MSAGAVPDPGRFTEAVDAFRARVPITKGEWLELDAAEREFAFTVAGVAEARMVSEVWDAIDGAIANGETLDDFKTRIADALEQSWGGEIPGRLETIFRTNINTAYNAGRHAVFTAPAVKEARPFWRYDLVADDRTCDECEPCDGVVLPADDPFWSENLPPLHMSCRCSFTALSEEEAAGEGVDDEAPDVEADDGFGEPPSGEGALPDE